MRIVYATAELAPVASVGGLAAAAAGLTAELRRQGASVDVLLPDYGDLELADEVWLDLDVPAWAAPAGVRVGTHPVCGRLHLVSVPGMARPHPYLQPDGTGWPDNDARFLAFSRAVAAYVEVTRPDVVHLNDWHTGAALAALPGSAEGGPPTVLSIHNLAYQGNAPSWWLPRLGPRAEHYEWFGGTNPLSGAIALADRIVAVSPNYVGEVLTPEGGFGLDGPLRSRADALVGVLNGIDTEVWDPATDPHIARNFDVDHLDDKTPNRSALCERLGWPDDGLQVATVVTRLTHQKGIDLLEPLVPVLDQVPVRLALLGSGDAELAARLRDAAARYPHSFAFVEGYDEALSHLMFAGADLYLMPSRFEPCGLTQMQAMRYGAVPVVTAVGGLVDTVPDADEHPRSGRGVVARRADPVDLCAALFRAARRMGDRRRAATLRRRGMEVDWSWRQPAGEHLALYRDLGARS